MQKITFISVLLILVGVIVLACDRYMPKSIPSSFTASNWEVSLDILGHSVTLPQGQLWGFNADQNIEVNIIDKKAGDDVVVVTAKLKAVVNFPAPDSKAVPPKDFKQAKQATMEGIAKLYYERVNLLWYLTHVEGVSLKVTAKE